ncbi:zinc finger protein [Homalodisca vitripennis]|nr:zinc finger protein [Homalodisca vitripennis]
MKRSASPLSENTLRRVLEDDSDVVVSDSETESEESSSLGYENTDSDPDYHPELPSTSNTSRPRLDNLLFRANDHLSSEDDAPDIGLDFESLPRPRPNLQTRPRGRPSNVGLYQLSETSSSDSEDGMGWDEVEMDGNIGFCHQFSFDELTGPKHAPPRNSSPSNYFKLFFTTALLETFVKYTNKYATEYINKSQLKPHSRANSWKPVSLLEMQAFLAVLINMGIKKQPTIYSYWWTSSSQFIPWFPRMFTRNRFQAILRFLHMVDTVPLAKPGEPDYDACARFKPLIDHVNRVFKFHFSPGQNLAIDESIISSKSHSQLRQYLPKKRHRWGIKLWMLCDSVTHYCLNFFVYKGANGSDKDEIKSNGLGYFVVKRLLEMAGLLNKGYHIFCDNFFTSLKLAKYLYSKCTFLTGTMRINRKGLPDSVKPKFKVGEKKYFKKNEMTLLAFREKQSQTKQVLVLTTDGTVEDEKRSKKFGNHIKTTNKPKVIRRYNDFMGGVDGGDQMLNSYLDERKALRFWRKVTFNIFGRMVLNSYIIYKKNTDKPLPRLEYTVALVEELSTEWLALQERRPMLYTSPGNSREGNAANNGSGDPDWTMFLNKLPNKKELNCSVCSKKSTQAGGKRPHLLAKHF